MSITVDATYEQGVLRLDERLELPEHSRVRVTITAPAEPSRTDLATRLRALRAEVVKSGAPLLDWAGIEEEVAARRGCWREDQ